MSETTYSLADAFLLNNRVNLQLLDLLSDEQLAHSANPRARNIAEQFAHLHNVRLMWLEVVAKGMPKLEKAKTTKAGLRSALTQSADAMAAVMAEAERSGKMKGYKRGPVAFFAYLVAHEGHHRGQIVLHLKNAGMPIEKMAGFALWQWEKI